MLFTAFVLAAAVPAIAAEPMRRDAKGRPVIAARVDGQGPFDMVVDTAAQRSVTTDELARTLRLEPLDSQLVVEGVAGRTAASLYRVKRLSSGVFDLRDVEILGLPRIGATAARAIIGIDVFADRRLVFDMAGARLVAEPSGPPRPGFVVHRGSTGDGLLTVPVVVDGVTIDALVDTGAEGSVANAAALKALGWRDDDARLRAFGAITGATAGGAIVRRGTVATLRLGPVALRDVPLTFPGRAADADAALERPAIILGMDVLGLLQAFALDMPRGELQILVPPRRPAQN